MPRAGSPQVLRDLSACFHDRSDGPRGRVRAMRMLVAREDRRNGEAAGRATGPRTIFGLFLLGRYRR